MHEPGIQHRTVREDVPEIGQYLPVEYFFLRRDLQTAIAGAAHSADQRVEVGELMRMVLDRPHRGQGHETDEQHGGQHVGTFLEPPRTVLPQELTEPVDPQARQHAEEREDREKKANAVVQRGGREKRDPVKNAEVQPDQLQEMMAAAIRQAHTHGHQPRDRYDDGRPDEGEVPRPAEGIDLAEVQGRDVDGDRPERTGLEIVPGSLDRRHPHDRIRHHEYEQREADDDVEQLSVPATAQHKPEQNDRQQQHTRELRGARRAEQKA